MEVHRAVILAAGVGTRMRLAVPDAVLTPDQRAVADAGLKGLMPFGRPFLDHVVSALAEAGIDEVCLVVGPGSHEIVAYVEGHQGFEGQRMELSTALQSRPLGTADALSSAASFTRDQPFLVLNSDNFYPVAGLRQLVSLGGAGLLAIERSATLRDPTTNLGADRLANFAVIEADAEGSIRRLEEKPARERYDHLPDPLWLSVNCWRFDPSIYDFCADLKPSGRGELELPAAALAAVEAGVTIRLVPTQGVLDLSTRADVAPVGRLLPGGSAL